MAVSRQYVATALQEWIVPQDSVQTWLVAESWDETRCEDANSPSLAVVCPAIFGKGPQADSRCPRSCCIYLLLSLKRLSPETTLGTSRSLPRQEIKPYFPLFWSSFQGLGLAYATGEQSFHFLLPAIPITDTSRNKTAAGSWRCWSWWRREREVRGLPLLGERHVMCDA